MRMTIGDRVERIERGVVDLGKSDLFIGHDWLKFNNPNIDWQKSSIVFDRCPLACGYNVNYMEIDEDPDNSLETDEDLIPHLEESDRLYGFDWDGYIAPKHLLQSSDLVPDYVGEFPEVFAEADFNQLPERWPWDHAIDINPGAKLSDCKIYPLNVQEQKVLDEFLEKNLRTGRIISSKSPMSSPFVFVKKKDGKLRPVQDYQKLNEMTVKNKYPLPLIQELVDKLKQSKVFTKLDIRWGYNNIRIKECDEWKAAFRTNRGLFEPTVMLFGLTNSPATFQGFMNEIFKDLISEEHVVIYMDNCHERSISQVTIV